MNGQSMTHINVTSVSVPPPLDEYITMFVNISNGTYYHLHHNEGLQFGAVIYGLPNNDTAYGYPIQLFLTANDIFGNIQSHMTSTGASVSSVSPDNSKQTVYTISSHMTSTISSLPAASTGSSMQKGYWCFQCEGMVHLKYCDKVKRCQDENEVCYVQKYPTGLSTSLYRSGCVSSEKCSHATGCIKCCNGDFCNKAGCGDEGLPALGHRGTLCFDCTYKDEGEDCNTVTQCHSHQACIVAKYEWGDNKFYHRMGCADTQVCSTKRSISQLTTRNVPVCSQCCSTDFCNMNCTSVDTFPSLVG